MMQYEVFYNMKDFFKYKVLASIFPLTLGLLFLGYKKLF